MIFTLPICRPGWALNSELIHKHFFGAMGGTFELSCFPQNLFTRPEVQVLFERAQKEVARIEDLLTHFRPSPFNRINEMAGIAPVAVDTEILSVLQRAQDFSRETGGPFDISFASPEPSYRDYRKIRVDEKACTVFLPHPGMKIGLGGIGKGYAVDRAFELLRAEGLVNFSVNGSGDVRVHSHYTAPRPWRIGVRNPFSPDPARAAGFVTLAEGAVATSGDYVNPDHVVNPKTGLPAKEVISATVVDVGADTKATLLMLLGRDGALEYLRKHNLKGGVITADGKSWSNHAN